ncbi:MAG: nucleotidyltransferase domain-containing protein [Clostridiales bacterium]|nr:nucleotidyltransferase domain-containing protein [Clostridiales bacterium]
MISSPIIKELASQIVASFDPNKIIMFSYKLNIRNEITSFKICMVIDTTDKEQLEKDIYISIDCCIPYDIIIYTPDEWDRLLQIPHSFAEKINATGVVLYDKTAN